MNHTFFACLCDFLRIGLRVAIITMFKFDDYDDDKGYLLNISWIYLDDYNE